MRKMEFKMERNGLVTVGEDLPITEYRLPNSWYYVLGKSLAMSENYPTRERVLSDHGTVLAIHETPKGYYVTVGLDE